MLLESDTPYLRIWSGHECWPQLTSFLVHRATDVCLTCAVAVVRSEHSKRQQIAQVSRRLLHQPIHLRSSGNLGFLTTIPLSLFLSGHGLLFKTKLEKSLAWKETQPGLQESQQGRPGTPGGFSEVMGSALA